jgi:hypothetical protein
MPLLQNRYKAYKELSVKSKLSKVANLNNLRSCGKTDMYMKARLDRIAVSVKHRCCLQRFVL